MKQESIARVRDTTNQLHCKRKSISHPGVRFKAGVHRFYVPNCASTPISMAGNNSNAQIRTEIYPKGVVGSDFVCHPKNSKTGARNRTHYTLGIYLHNNCCKWLKINHCIRCVSTIWYLKVPLPDPHHTAHAMVDVWSLHLTSTHRLTMYCSDGRWTRHYYQMKSDKEGRH